MTTTNTLIERQLDQLANTSTKAAQIKRDLVTQLDRLTRDDRYSESYKHEQAVRLRSEAKARLDQLATDTTAARDRVQQWVDTAETPPTAEEALLQETREQRAWARVRALLDAGGDTMNAGRSTRPSRAYVGQRNTPDRWSTGRPDQGEADRIAATLGATLARLHTARALSVRGAWHAAPRSPPRPCSGWNAASDARARRWWPRSPTGWNPATLPRCVRS